MASTPHIIGVLNIFLFIYLFIYLFFQEIGPADISRFKGLTSFLLKSALDQRKELDQLLTNENRLRYISLFFSHGNNIKQK